MVFSKKMSGFQLNISSLHPKATSNIWNLSGEIKIGNKTLRLVLDKSQIVQVVLWLHFKPWLSEPQEEGNLNGLSTTGILNCDVLCLLSRFSVWSGQPVSVVQQSNTLCKKAVYYVIRFFIYLKASTWSTMHFFPPSSSKAHFWCLWRFRHLLWRHTTQSLCHCKTHLCFINKSTLAPALWRSLPFALLPQNLWWLQCQQSQRSLERC